MLVIDDTGKKRSKSTKQIPYGHYYAEGKAQNQRVEFIRLGWVE